MTRSQKRASFGLCAIVAIASAGSVSFGWLGREQQPAASARALRIVQDARAGTLTIFRQGRGEPLVVQSASPNRRPSLQQLTSSAGTPIDRALVYWTPSIVNGRDFHDGTQPGFWRRVSVTVTERSGDEVRWQTVYDLLDASGAPMLTDTERWTLRDRGGRLELDFEWRGEARTDVTLGAKTGSTDAAAGLVLRLPSRDGLAGEVVNAARQRNERADGQRAMWVDVAVPVAGRSQATHVALFDHPDNGGYPQAWRVDQAAGVSPARSRDGDWVIKKGETEVVRHRVVIYGGAFNDIELTAAWSQYSGNRSTYSTSALWTVAQREGRTERFLSPDQAAAAMTMVPGYAVNAWAAEPMVVQPMAFCWDDRGRLWVAENRDYEARGRGFSNAGTSRILILEDTNHDGVADSRKVFMDDIVFPSAIAVGFDGVFVGAPPNLLFVPDRDGDDRADMADIEVRLTGWGIRDRHEVMNSLQWGPDGWLYGLQGFATPSKIRKPIGKGRLFKPGESFPEDVLEGEGVEINGGVWRYHPTKDRFEVVAHGFSNPWGIDYDAKGQLLMSACVIPHLWHVVPGGIYQRQGGQHFNPYVYSDIQTIADHRHRSAHGGARVYQSDAFPTSQRGRIFMANIHEHAVLSDVLVPQGSGFTARHGDDFLMANNAQWVGFSLEIGPEGALYVLDWHDADICGADVLHHETGRIFRIVPKESRAEAWPGRYADLGKMLDAALVAMQTSRSDWHARRARVILQGRAAKGTIDPGTREDLLRLFITQEDPDWRLRAMWALHVIGGWTPEALVDALGDRDEHVRAWAIQLLCEDRSPSPLAIEAFSRLAREDRSPIVRLYLASALQRIDRGARWDIAAGLMTHAEDAQDHNLPKMIWLGVEPTVADNPSRALDHVAGSNIPLVTQFIARRSVDADALEPLVAALSRSSNPRTQASLLEGMRDGLEGRVDLATPAGWPNLLERLKRSGNARIPKLAGEVAQQFGDTETARRNFVTVRNTSAPTTDRRKALQTLAAQRRPELVGDLPAALDSSELRIDAIRAIAAFDDDGLGKQLIARFSSFNAAEKADAIQTLASRARYGRFLTDALAANTIARREVPPYVARQLRRVVGVRFAEVWGPVEQTASEEKAYARYRGLLTDRAIAAANLAHGRTLFQQTCGACHKLYGEGGTIGPDITGSNRANLEYLLANVLNPNAEVADAYKLVVITTRDGRTLSGNVGGETDRQLTLRVVGREPVTIGKADIQSREATASSMMPPGLLDALTDGEVIDLVAYLRTHERIGSAERR